MKRLAPKSSAAFTLIEILLVIIIIISLMAVLIPNIQNAIKESRIGNAKIYISRLNSELQTYELQYKRPPTTDVGLRALVEKGVEAKLEEDPWGTPYQYEFPGKHNPKGFDVFSCGPDRLPGTPDDIGNWDSEPAK